jgi:hypothetical protein
MKTRSILLFLYAFAYSMNAMEGFDLSSFRDQLEDMPAQSKIYFIAMGSDSSTEIFEKEAFQRLLLRGDLNSKLNALTDAGRIPVEHVLYISFLCRGAGRTVPARPDEVKRILSELFEEQRSFVEKDLSQQMAKLSIVPSDGGSSNPYGVPVSPRSRVTRENIVSSMGFELQDLPISVPGIGCEAVSMDCLCDVPVKDFDREEAMRRTLMCCPSLQDAQSCEDYELACALAMSLEEMDRKK